MEPLLPLFTNDLLREVDQKLYDLLSSITEKDWQKQIAVDGWSVKDVLSHLVDVILRRLSAGRDRYTPAKAVVLDRYQDLVNYVEDLADQWVGTFRRVSPQLVLSLFHDYQDALYKYFCSLNPYDLALGVAWANESVSCVWFDLAREYSEH
ncbi:MAG: DinB family protein [Erysipelotrichaceae bacterium]|jgi:hypothetical protein|nr:DinB family protein [Erysipelotrichaceae bacterium]